MESLRLERLTGVPCSNLLSLAPFDPHVRKEELPVPCFARDDGVLFVPGIHDEWVIVNARRHLVEIVSVQRVPMADLRMRNCVRAFFIEFIMCLVAWFYVLRIFCSLWSGIYAPRRNAELILDAFDAFHAPHELLGSGLLRWVGDSAG